MKYVLGIMLGLIGTGISGFLFYNSVKTNDGSWGLGGFFVLVATYGMAYEMIHGQKPKSLFSLTIGDKKKKNKESKSCQSLLIDSEERE